MPASPAPRDETDGLASIPCSKTPADGSSISSWHGRLTNWSSLSDSLDTIQHLDAGVDLYLHLQAIETTTPMGKLVFQLTGAFAEFERTMIRQRIKAGLKRAIAQGVKLGRPKIDSAIERCGYLKGRQVARARDWHRAAHRKGACLKDVTPFFVLAAEPLWGPRQRYRGVQNVRS
jgi:hypothetical protein